MKKPDPIFVRGRGYRLRTVGVVKVRLTVSAPRGRMTDFDKGIARLTTGAATMSDEQFGVRPHGLIIRPHLPRATMVFVLIAPDKCRLVRKGDSAHLAVDSEGERDRLTNKRVGDRRGD